MEETRDSDFFSPKSVAIIGTSQDPKKTGNAFVENLFNHGFWGED